MGGKVGGIGVGDTVPAMLTLASSSSKKDRRKMQPFLSRLEARAESTVGALERRLPERASEATGCWSARHRPEDRAAW